MELSDKVAQPASRKSPTGKPINRRTNSPFGGMNLTEARIRGAPQRPSQAQLKRSSGGREVPKEKDKSGYKALKMQQALSVVSYGQRSRVKDKIADSDTFDKFPLLPVIRDSITPQALKSEDPVPTPVQRLALQALLGSGKRRRRGSTGEMEQFLLAAETGSGKTLAYMLPVMDAIKRAEAEEAEQEARERAGEEEQRKGNVFELEPPPLSNAPHPTTGRPRAIILVPTAELVAQVGAVAKSFSHTVKFKAAPLSSAYSGIVIRNRIFSPNGVDIVISTPHLLASIAESDPNVLSRVTHLVVDEADSLLDRSFSPMTSAIIDKSAPSLRQLILCSATIPRSLDSYLQKRFPDITRLVTPNLHAIPRRVQLGVVEVEKDPYKGNKNLACADTIWQIGKSAEEHGHAEEEKIPTKRILVFVNEREQAAEVAEYLVSKGINAFALSRDTAEQRHSTMLAEFTGAETKAKPAKSTAAADAPNAPAAAAANSAAPGSSSAIPKRSLANVKVLVTTDIASRGIDTTNVRHVILYDVPHTTIDFIHRLGRTGRMGRRGRGIVLVGRNDRKDIVREVRDGMFRGQALI